MITPERERELMEEAIREASLCSPEDKRTHPMVGAVLADREGNIIARAHRNEDGRGAHAEFMLLEKKVAGHNLSNASAVL
jgi:pyrimidine deaminase RibD-like protein